MSELAIRNYRPEDFVNVVELYSSTRTESPFFVRDGQYFNYFLSYPGVSQDSVFVAANDGIEGVAIIAINQDEKYTVGRVIELWTGETAVGKALVQKAVEYCRAKNVDKLEISPPAFLDSSNIFTGWESVNQRETIMTGILSLRPLLEALFDTMVLGRIGSGRGFLFVCDDETVRVKINGTEANVVVAELPGGHSDVMVRLSSQTLLQVIFADANPYIALLTGRIKIRPLRDIFRGLRMLRAIRVEEAWTAEIVDRR